MDDEIPFAPEVRAWSRDAEIWAAICNRRAAVLELTGRDEPAQDTVEQVAEAHDLHHERVRQVYRERIACMVGS